MLAELHTLPKEMLVETGGPLSAAERRTADAALGMQEPVSANAAKAHAMSSHFRRR